MVRIVNERNFDRLTDYLERSKGDKVYGGEYNKETLQIRPTIVTNVTMEDSLMEDELFGPICPVIKANYREAIQSIAK